LLWGGDRDEARALVRRINQSSLPQENKLIAQLRQACADGGRGAGEIASTLDSDPRTSTSTRWQVWMLMGDEKRAPMA